MKKRFIIIMIAVLNMSKLLAQAPTPPAFFQQVFRPTYIDETKVRVIGVKEWGAVNSLANSDKIVTRTYYDGLNRPVQQIEFGKGNATKADIVSFNVYDSYGNKRYKYLPYATNTNWQYQSAFVAPQSTFYAMATVGKYAKDTPPYSESVFDNSPLNSILKQGAAGTAWQVSTGKIKSSVTRTNIAADNVRKFNVDGASTAFWAAGSLIVSELTDEEGGKTLQFADKDNKILLVRNWVNETIQGQLKDYKETYYVYHFSGLPVMTIPPKVTDRLRNGAWAMTADDLNNNVYRYEYDTKGRLIRKKTPSAGWSNIVYDNLDRVCLLQTAVQALSNKWYFVKRDKTDRIILDGILTDNTRNTRALMQTFADTFDYLNTALISYEAKGGTQMGYTDYAFPKSTGGFTTYVIQNAYYYHSYDTDNNGTAEYSYQNQALGTDEPVVGSVQGKLAVLKTLQLGTSNWIIKVYFYDREGKLVQEQSNNATNTAVADAHTNSFNFDETLKKSVKRKTIGTTQHIIRETMTYDNVARVASISHQYNSNTAVTIAEYKYNELGQLVDRNLGKITATTYLQSVDLRYNIRGWLIGINNSTFTNDGYNEETNDVFGIDVYYNTVGDFGNTALFNGKISGVRWKSKQTTHPFNNIARSYMYSYDKLGQLRNSLFKGNNGTGGWVYKNDTYSEKNISYDLNGNQLTLERNMMDLSTGTLVQMDNLTYAYKTTSGGDKVQTVNDSYAAAGNYGFKGISVDTEEYVYDVGGRLIQDKNKNMTYTYNDIGKIDRTTISSAPVRHIQYNYTASGELLSKQVVSNSVTLSTTNYLDNFVAEGNVLNFVSHGEGRVRTASGVGTYEYYIKDQQGNVRVSFENVAGVATVRQENSYYPFGLVHNATITPTMPNKNLYNNGSEWQNDFANDPDLLNTGFRQYDPVMGKFNAVDPVADQFPGMSGYSYAFNDPVSFNDPTGAYPDGGYYDDNGYHPPANWWIPQGAYQNETLEQWYMTPGDRWLRNAYYRAGMGSFYDQNYGYIGRQYTIQTTSSMPYSDPDHPEITYLDVVDIHLRTVTVFSRNPLANMSWNGASNFTDKNTNPNVDFALGAIEAKLGAILADRGRYGRIGPEVILRTPIANFQIATKSLQGFGNTLKWTGRGLGFVGLAGTTMNYLSGKTGETETTLDLIMGGVGFLPGYGWAASGVYSLLKSDAGRALEMGASDHYKRNAAALAPGGNFENWVCFTKETLVFTENGLKEIGEIKVGEKVYTYNFNSKRLELGTVQNTLERSIDQLYEISTNSNKIFVTAEHPFYVENKGWTKVKDLQVDDRFKTKNTNYAENIKSINQIKKGVTVYNLEVDGNHNYFITNSFLLVHNKQIQPDSCKKNEQL